MLRRTPPLESIEIFVAAAHGESFRAVARRMALSPSAVSRRISALEAFLGFPLFDRAGQTQTLNAAGRRYMSMVEPAIDAIRRASAMAAGTDSQTLRVATSHSFANAWLMPRLPELRAASGIEVDIIPTRDFDALRSGAAQLAIWGGMEVPDDIIAEKIADAHLFPVAAPSLLDGQGLPLSPLQIARHRLLAVKTPTGSWDRWLAAAGLENHPRGIREFATLQLMYEAAVAGLGIALAVPLVSEPYLESGRLLPCSNQVHSVGESYRIYRVSRRIYRTETEQRFASWLHGAAHHSLRRHEALTATS
jgi:LysR family transcriptional regulator, glycine cleavage system transcriptional activator